MEPLLKVDGVWKRYSRDLRKSLRYGAQELFGLRKSGPNQTLDESEFWALRDISFCVGRGEVLGILGPNGAGKSTLLKTIAGKLRPDSGAITVRGKLGYIIEMSAGFSPTLTGRENVSLRGRLMGLRGKELETYVAEVQDFADLAEHFDSSVQFYSSGMRARLGFSTSVAIRPDVLILDEVLAVGDLGFRIKCYERINHLARNAAVVFVSHSLNQMGRLCTKGMYLEKGRALHIGSIQDAISLYDKSASGRTDGKAVTLSPEKLGIRFFADGQVLSPESSIAFGSKIHVEIVPQDLPENSQLRVMLRNSANDPLMEWNSERAATEWRLRSNHKITAHFGPAELNPGKYSFVVQAMSPAGSEMLSLTSPFWFRVSGHHVPGFTVQRRAVWEFQAPAAETVKPDIST